MDKSFIVGTTLVGLVTVAIIAGSVVQTTAPVNTMAWTSAVCVYKNGELIGPCEHNLVTNIGLNWTRDKISGFSPTTGSAVVLVLGNGTQGDAAPTATTLSGQINDCALTPNVSAYNGTLTGSIANFSVTQLWTSSCSNVYVNATALYNNSAPGTSCAITNCTMFAVKNFTSGVNLSAGDQLNVTWFVWANST
jgi:hypothetical protein